MSPEQLDEQLSAEPFIPLRIHLTDGTKLDINNPALVVINRLALYVFRVDRPKSHLARDYQLISLRHIVQVEQVAEAAG